MIHRDVMEINYVMHENILAYLKERCNSRSPALQILYHLSHQGSQLQVICTINSKPANISRQNSIQVRITVPL